MAADSSRIKELFVAALEQPDRAARQAFVERECADDADLRQRLEALLQAHDAPASVLNQPLLQITPEESNATATIDSPATAGLVIAGRYKLLEEIGEGGMGTVWMAQQTEPVQRRVAIKLIKAGMDSRQVVARFEAERQALALMDHPNIAKVHDGGLTEAGRPYFAMELVKGTPITKYCDEKKLPVRERLELFADVCRAIQHAHQKGIIHRDLKPSNVLVALFDGKPVVKVIDFGVAKATGQKLTEATLFTGFGAVVGTPEYMSPEQAELNNADIDTRSDIYSLGVLLYELLTGTTPLTKQRVKEAALLEVLRVIREEEAPRPSTRLSTTEELPSIAAVRRVEPAKLTKLVRGELDWIVMKAIEKDRNRRYDTANGFAMDVQRYLADEPVQAGPPSALYRFRKFARRNKGALTTTAVLFLAAIILAAGLTWNLTDRAARHRRLTDEVELGLSQADRQLDTGSWAAARQTVLRVRSLLAAGHEDHRLNQRVAHLQSRLDMVTRLERIRSDVPIHDDSFDFAETEAAYVRAFREFGIDVDAMSMGDAAIAIRQSQIHAELIAALDDCARIRRAMGKAGWQNLIRIAADVHQDGDSLWEHWRYALKETNSPALLEVAADAEHRELEPLKVLLLVRTLKVICKATEKTVSGKSADEIVERLLVKAQQKHPDDYWINLELGMHLHRFRPRRLDEAIRYYSVALALQPQNPGGRSGLAAALSDHGKYDEALTLFQQVKDLIPESAMVRFNIGQTLRLKGHRDESMAAYREALHLNPRHIDARYALAGMLREEGKAAEAEAEYLALIDIKPNEHLFHTNLGVVLSSQGKKAAAEAQYRKAIELEPKNHLAHYNLGFLLAGQGKLEEAEIHLHEAIRHKPGFADAHQQLGFVLGKQGKVRDAMASYRKAIELNPSDEMSYCNLGSELRDLGQFAEAEEKLREAIKLNRNFAAAHYNLGLVFHRQGKSAEAGKEYREAIRLDASDAEAHCNLGHVLAAQGAFRQAVEELRVGHELGSKNPRWRYPSAQWLRAAERLADLDARLPKILKGKDRPTDSAERVAIAQLCQHPSKQLNNSAARFYAEAFAADSKLAEDLRTQLRYNAACAAALAGSGKGKDAGDLDGKERERLRRQALGWLRADLEAFQRAEKGADKNRPVVQQTMRHWQQDEDLAGVRGDAMTKLPDVERQEWQKLWQEVEELRKRAAEGKRP